MGGDNEAEPDKDQDADAKDGDNEADIEDEADNEDKDEDVEVEEEEDDDDDDEEEDDDVEDGEKELVCLEGIGARRDATRRGGPERLSLEEGRWSEPKSNSGFSSGAVPCSSASNWIQYESVLSVAEATALLGTDLLVTTGSLRCEHVPKNGHDPRYLQAARSEMKNASWLPILEVSSCGLRIASTEPGVAEK